MTVFSQIDRATIFDPSWSMSWHFMPIPPQPLSRLWIYGDAECEKHFLCQLVAFN